MKLDPFQSTHFEIESVEAIYAHDALRINGTI